MHLLRKITDYLLIPLFIFVCAYEPNFIHGFIDHLEAGQFLSAINEVFYGKIPIKDIYTLYGPLHIYLPALAMQVFGKSLAVLRAYFHFGSILTLIIAYFLGRSILRNRFFIYSLAFFLLVEVNHPFWSTRAGGIRGGLGFLTLLFLIYFIKNRKKHWLILAATLNSVSLLYSIEIGVISFLVSIITIFFLAFTEKKHRISVTLKISLFYITGMFLIILPFFIYFYLKGALQSYLVTSFFILPKYHVAVWGQPTPHFIPVNLTYSNFLPWLLSAHFKMFLPIFIYPIIILYIFLKFIKDKITSQLIIISILTVYGLLFYKISFRAILGPQFQIPLTIFLILGYYFLEKCYLFSKKYYHFKITNIKKIIVIFFTMCLLSFSFIYLLYSQKRFYFSLKGWLFYQTNKNKLMPMYMAPILIKQIDMAPLEIERAKGIIVPYFQKKEIDGVTNYIIQNTEPKELLFTFPEYGIYNFFADRRAIDKFVIAGLAFTKKEYQQELLNDLKNTRPKYIIFGKYLSNLAKSIGREKELLPEVSDFIKENYIVVKSFYTVDIYRIK